MPILEYSFYLCTLLSNMLKPFINTALEEIHYSAWQKKGVAVSVLRDDLIHPFMSGNKWRKLKYNIIDFNDSGKKVLLTFGGAFSNHLVAAAAAASEYGFDSIGIVRGEEVDNPYLNFVKQNGMKLFFISREEYRKKNEQETISTILDLLITKEWIKNREDVFLLPEGGANPAAVRGASEIINDIDKEFDWIACACGTGATLAGISQKLSGNQKALGIPVLKADGYMEKEIEKHGGINDRIILNENYHFGGYAKKNKTLEAFCRDFSAITGIPIEPVYTGKLFYAIDDLIKTNYFKKGEKVTAIHTGGVFCFPN